MKGNDSAILVLLKVHLYFKNGSSLRRSSTLCALGIPTSPGRVTGWVERLLVETGKRAVSTVTLLDQIVGRGEASIPAADP